MTKNASSADSMKGFLLLASKGPQRTMGQERTYALGFNVTKGKKEKEMKGFRKPRRRWRH